MDEEYEKETIQEIIDDKIENLNKLNTDLDALEELLESGLFNKDYSSLMKEISPTERVDLNWNIGYSIYTMYYLYLKLENIDPNHHDVKKEMKRLQDFHNKINQVKKEQESDKKESTDTNTNNHNNTYNNKDNNDN